MNEVGRVAAFGSIRKVLPTDGGTRPPDAVVLVEGKSEGGGLRPGRSRPGRGSQFFEPVDGEQAVVRRKAHGAVRALRSGIGDRQRPVATSRGFGERHGGQLLESLVEGAAEASRRARVTETSASGTRRRVDIGEIELDTGLERRRTGQHGQTCRCRGSHTAWKPPDRAGPAQDGARPGSQGSPPGNETWR